nr:FKBP-type peptidyl-prolyl cis-trans isomerase [Flexivirga meconopsidis]
MSAIKVDTKDPKKPAVSLSKKPFQVNKTTVNVLKEGTGPAVKDDQIASVDYTVMDGKTGKALANTFSDQPVTLALKDPAQFPGLVSAIKGKKVGTTETVAIPPKDAFGDQGNPQLGVGAGDTLVFYMKINSAVTPLKEATGKAVAPKSGMPTVKWDGAAKPATITMPNADAPKKLESANLINGDGAEVKKGQTVYALYTGVVWTKGKAGKVFDSTGTRGGQPTGFPIGVGKVIPGWDKTLVGKKVGDRVLIVVPPAEGYGSAGSQDGSIKGTDTIVFAVDIVAAI